MNLKIYTLTGEPITVYTAGGDILATPLVVEGGSTRVKLSPDAYDRFGKPFRPTLNMRTNNGLKFNLFRNRIANPGYIVNAYNVPVDSISRIVNSAGQLEVESLKYPDIGFFFGTHTEPTNINGEAYAAGYAMAGESSTATPPWVAPYNPAIGFVGSDSAVPLVVGVLGTFSLLNGNSTHNIDPHTQLLFYGSNLEAMKLGYRETTSSRRINADNVPVSGAVGLVAASLGSAYIDFETGARINAAYELIDDQGRFVSPDGQLFSEAYPLGYAVDDQGRRIDSEGRLIDEHGNFIDDQGRRVDSEGRLIDNYGNFIDETGHRIDLHGHWVDNFGHPMNVSDARVDHHGRSVDAAGFTTPTSAILPTQFIEEDPTTIGAFQHLLTAADLPTDCATVCPTENDEQLSHDYTTLPSPNLGAFGHVNTPMVGDVSTLPISDAMTLIQDGDVTASMFEKLMDKVAARLDASLENNRINHETYQKFYIEMMPHCITEASKSALGLIQGAQAIVDAEIKVKQLKLERHQLGFTIAMDTWSKTLRTKVDSTNVISTWKNRDRNDWFERLMYAYKANKGAYEAVLAKENIRQLVYNGFVNRQGAYISNLLSARKVDLTYFEATALDAKIGLFNAQKDGFKDKKQNEFMSHAMDVWSVSAVEGLDREYQFAFTHKTPHYEVDLSEPDGLAKDVDGNTIVSEYDISELEEWMRDYMNDTPEITSHQGS